MTNNFTEDFNEHINFAYTCFDRLILRGYIISLFTEGSVIGLLRNLGFNKHSNGVLKISSYLPFPCEFYINGHNYLKQQFDIHGQDYKMKDNSFTQVDNLVMLEDLVNDFQPSMALNRIDYWMSIFFKFNKGQKSTRSKLLSHKWYISQTEIP